MQVKIISEKCSYNLEDEINDWLKAHSNVEIVDIKYSGGGDESVLCPERYSAMIIYKQRGDNNV